MFNTFFLAGFEGTTGYNKNRQWIDEVVATQHDRFVQDDYARLRAIGIGAVRESVRWPLVDRRGRYDFSSLNPVIQAAREHEIEVLYDLFHFGYPDDLDLFSNTFSSRFADYSYAVARYVAANTSGVCYFAPVNEPSFLAWAAGEAGLFAPHLCGRGWELKVRLIEAAIQGINAIWSASSATRIVNIDPICRIVTRSLKDEAHAEVEAFNSAVFQGWDMLSGRLNPELGGSPKHLGIIGANYYWTNQWEVGNSGSPLLDDDERRWPLNKLLTSVWRRYGAEMLLTETAHIGERRGDWIRELATEVEDLITQGVPINGVCLYPIIGMHDWHSTEEWPRMGLWDLVRKGDRLDRVPVVEALQAFREARRLEERHTMTRPRQNAVALGAR